MGMRGGYAEHIIARFTMPGNLEEFALHAVINHVRVTAVIALQVVGGGLRHCDQAAGTPRCAPQQEIPEWKIEPAKIVRMPFMLEIVKHRDHRAFTKQRRGE